MRVDLFSRMLGLCGMYGCWCGLKLPLGCFGCVESMDLSAGVEVLSDASAVLTVWMLVGSAVLFGVLWLCCMHGC